MKDTCKYFGWVLFLMIYSTNSYSATLIVDNGALMGATGIDVDGVLYDVQFIDGTCDALYSGCDSISDFPFSNPTNDPTLLNIAMTALLEQVLIDSPLGNFDSNPALTNGCNVSGGCQINTPLFPSSSTEFIASSGAFNSIDEFRDTITAGSAVYNSVHPFPELDQNVFAVWNQSVVVPIPAAIWLFSSGLLGLIGAARRKA